jgi:hypothetical protein
MKLKRKKNSGGLGPSQGGCRASKNNYYYYYYYYYYFVHWAVSVIGLVAVGAAHKY